MPRGLKRFGSAASILLVALIIPSSYGADKENPWDYLKDFRHVRGAIVPVEEHYVAALFHEGQRNLKALVLFPADCASRRCSLGEPVAYSVFDRRGLMIRFHEEPDQQPLLQRLIISGSVWFRAA
jgi:hypothetical protein